MWNKTGQNNYCYNSCDVCLCGGRIYNLYVDVIVVLVRYVVIYKLTVTVPLLVILQNKEIGELIYC